MRGVKRGAGSARGAGIWPAGALLLRCRGGGMRWKGKLTSGPQVSAADEKGER
jgi:hypothetical protein